MKTIFALAAFIAMGVFAIVGSAYSGFYEVSAISSNSGLVHWLLSTTSHASVERRAKDIKVPDLEIDSLISAGVNDFDTMCVDCHGAPGKPPAAVGQGLNPSAPDLAVSAEHMTPAELFWVTKNGIKMTGMPAWGATHDDDALWPVVAFMTVLPTLDAQGYEALLVDAEGLGHHGSSDASHDETPSLAEPIVEEEEHDHDDHEH